MNLGETFDLVQTLEVAEHLPAASAGTFVESLVRHGRRILFSAAVPGQIGVCHINERPHAYWRDLFAEHGYVMLDLIRPKVHGNTAVKYWYRFQYVSVRGGIGGRQAGEGRPRRPDRSPPAAVPDVAPQWLKVAASFFTRRLSGPHEHPLGQLEHPARGEARRNHAPKL